MACTVPTNDTYQGYLAAFCSDVESQVVGVPLGDGYTRYTFNPGALPYTPISSPGLPDPPPLSSAVNVYYLDILRDVGGLTQLRNIRINGVPVVPDTSRRGRVIDNHLKRINGRNGN